MSDCCRECGHEEYMHHFPHGKDNAYSMEFESENIKGEVINVENRF